MKVPMLVCLLLLLLGTASAQETIPTAVKIVRLEVIPKTIDLKTPFDYRQVLVTGIATDGSTYDLTRQAKLIINGTFAHVSATGIVSAHADGTGELAIEFRDLSAKIPVSVGGTQAKYEVGFIRDVNPVLSKMGCNQGTCHGAQDGKAGFKLSLRGYDPIYDYRSLIDDLEGRRFNRVAPERSLMLLKPSGAVPHVGGVLMQPTDPYYRLLQTWIANGVKYDADAPRVTSLDVQPQGTIIPVIGMKQQMRVVARYSDGSERDVTQEAFLESSNTECATVDKYGLVTAVRRGEATMLARFEGAYAASAVIVMGDRSGFQWQQQPQHNWIDELVDAKLKRVKVTASGLCTDAEFLRRVHLDVTGLPPTADEVRAFLADNRPTRIKRDEVIDKLVGSDAFIEHWTNKWADLLQVNRKFLGEPGAKALREWIRNAVATNMPYDKFAFALLTGTGSNVANPPAAYFKILRTPDLAMENTTHLFLAIRFNCNKCHDHPFERWTQDQYYQLGSYFVQVARKEDPNYAGQKLGGSAVEGAVPLVEIISDTTGGDIKHERTGVLTKPKFPFEHAAMPKTDKPRRLQLAEWITAKENPYFARSYVNRIWSYLTGVGIIEPIDDIRAGNPPSNPELLDRLTKEFIASGFDVRALIKTICKSRTYQLSIATNAWNKDDTLNYARAIARPLPAETLYDSITRSVGANLPIPGLPAGSRAAQMLDSTVDLPSGFLAVFGKPVRESACECERSNNFLLGSVLNLVNGPVVADAVKDPNNRLAQLVATIKDDGKLVEEIFLSILNRFPTDAEKAAGIQALYASKDDMEQMVANFNMRKAAFEKYEKDLDARQAQWEKSFDTATANWEVLKVSKFETKAQTVLTKLDDDSLLASGPNPTEEVYKLTLNAPAGKLTGLRLDALTHPSLPHKGPGRATANGNFVVNDLRVKVRPADKPDAELVAVKLRRPQAQYSQGGWPVNGLIDNNLSTGWANDGNPTRNNAAVFDFNMPLDMPNGAVFVIELEQRYAGGEHNLGRFKLSVTKDKTPKLGQVLSDHLIALLTTPPEKRTPEQKAELQRMHRATDAEYGRLRELIAVPPPSDVRVLGAQDLAWALINSSGFLFNH